jgi:hypothetical protein
MKVRYAAFAWVIAAASIGSADPIAGPNYELSTMSESRRPPLPPISVPSAAPTADRRPMWVGAGLVLLAGALWWNHRRRASLDS